MWLTWGCAFAVVSYLHAAIVLTIHHVAISPAHAPLVVEPVAWLTLYGTHLSSPTLFASLYGSVWWVWLTYLVGCTVGIGSAYWLLRSSRPPTPPRQPVLCWSGNRS